MLKLYIFLESVISALLPTWTFVGNGIALAGVISEPNAVRFDDVSKLPDCVLFISILVISASGLGTNLKTNSNLFGAVPAPAVP